MPHLSLEENQVQLGKFPKSPGKCVHSIEAHLRSDV